MSDDIELPDGPLHFVSACRANELRGEVARLRPIVEHVAGLTVQDEGGYSKIHSSVIEDARKALA